VESQYYRQIADTTLEVVELGRFAKTFCLRKYPGRSDMATYLIFTPFSIIITGDNRVENHGVQALGYGLDWFKRNLDSDYLAEKFLETRWVPEFAQKYWTDILEEWRGRRNEWLAKLAEEQQDLNAEDREMYEEPVPDCPELQPRTWHVGRTELDNATIVEALETLFELDCFSSPGELWNTLPAYEESCLELVHSLSFLCPFNTDSMGGYGYLEAKVGWLAAIHQRFAELYPQVEATLEPLHEKAPA